jgi:hypothetical protein
VAVVGLEETLYRVMEGVGTVEVCTIFYQPPAVVACPAPFPFNVSISTRIGTAEPPMDYVSLVSIMLRFEACAREACTSVTIVDDLVDEPDESFFVILGETPDLDARITLAPTQAEIVIEDNDIPIVVGYEVTTHTTTETDGYVELCAVIFETLSGLAPRPFELTVNTGDGSARKIISQPYTLENLTVPWFKL